MDNAVSVPKTESPVNSSLSKIEKQASNVGQLLNELEEQLGTILSPRSESKVEATPDKPESSCPMQTRLEAIIDMLQRNLNVFADIQGRIRV